MTSRPQPIDELFNRILSLWRCQNPIAAIDSTDNQTQIDIVCSGCFVESLNEEDCYQSSAFPDVIATA